MFFAHCFFCMTLWVAEISATHFSILRVYYTTIKFFCQVFYATFLEFFNYFNYFFILPQAAHMSVIVSSFFFFSGTGLGGFGVVALADLVAGFFVFSFAFLAAT